MAVLRPRYRGRRNERGAVAMEAALVLPILMLLVFGMIDMSLMLRDYVSVTSATRAATRFAATEANAGGCTSTDTSICPSAATVPLVAQDAADQVQSNLTALDPKSVNYLLVYEANQNGYPCSNANTCNAVLTKKAGGTPDTFNGPMPSSCAGYANCVKFTFNTTAKAFRYNAAGSTGWKSSDISSCVGNEDNVGVYLNLSHAWLTGYAPFSGTYTMSDRATARFEPLDPDTCDSTKHQ